VVTPTIHAKVLREVIQPVMRGMESEGIVYTGFLYAGLMISPDGGLKVLEFNCRMGDPETQPIMLRLKSDLAAIVEHAVNGTLDKVEAEWDRRTALGVVMAAANYPDTPRKGDVITRLPKKLEDAHVFHAGTTMQDGKVVTSGGRVLCVVALGDMVKQAQNRAYEIADTIHFDGCQMRRDIGYRAIVANKSSSPRYAHPLRACRRGIGGEGNERVSMYRSILSARSIAAHLKRGGLVAYPTESCYGLGCDPANRLAVLRILKLKRRPQRKGLISSHRTTIRSHAMCNAHAD